MPDPLAQLHSALANRYTIERELGRGGNAVVYLAHDVKHDRKVALKVLAPELALSVRSERFLREIQISAKLTHPHVLTLIDSGEAEGFLYYVMPYVAGESLRDRLKREKQLPLADALRITADVAAALSHAHSHGVVHRDIKPENILLSGGEAVVADFGIARALTVAGGQTVTETGVAVGTPAYMSPEQASGATELDARSDVYGLACVLYELLAGHPPFSGATAQEILARHALDPPPSLRAARAAVPPHIEAAVTRALAKQPADRYKTAAEFAAALTATPAGRPSVRAPQRRLVYFGLALVGLLAASAVAARSLLVRGAARSGPSIAVLPFVNMTGDPASEYLSDGVSEELINALVQLPGLRVPARTSSFFFKGKDLSLRQIGESLQVATVLEGSLRTAGSRLRITAQLIQVADGYHLWSETYDRELSGVEDMIAVEEEVARAIVGALQVRLTGAADRPLVARHTANPEARELYLKGRYFWHRRTRDDRLKAIQYFEAAIAADSGYALAYSGLADAYVDAGSQDYLPTSEANVRAWAAATQALALDETLAEAHTSLARMVMSQRGDRVAAEREFKRAIELSPNYALAHSWYAYAVLAGAGRFDEAIREARLGVKLDPLSPGITGLLALVLQYAGRYDDAIAYSLKAVELQPDNAAAHRTLARSYQRKGMFRQALAAHQRAVALDSGPRSLAELGALYARTGNRTQAVMMLDRLRAMALHGNVWRELAIVHAWLGDNDSAFAALERAHAGGEPLFNIMVNPVFDPLRSDLRFAGFVKKLRRER